MIKNLESRKKKGGDGRELHSENAFRAGARRGGIETAPQDER